MTTIQLDMLETALCSPNVPPLCGGTNTHDPALKLVGQLVSHTQDVARLQAIVAACLPQNYEGDTLSEVPGMVESAIAKGFDQPSSQHDAGTLSLSGGVYQPGTVGPLVMGYLADSRFVFFDQGRRLLIVESSSRIISPGALLNLAPFDFWQQRFPHKNGFNAYVAGISLMDAARAKGGFDERLIRGRGVYIDDGRVVRNFGEAPPANSNYVYVCALPISLEEDGNTIDPAAVLAFFRLFNFRSPSAPYILFGWLVSATITGALDWRPHVFLTGAKNSGKTTLISAIEKVLVKVAVALDGQSTEAGIRQRLGADSLAVILDEFESDQNLGRMRQVIKLIRSASSGLLGIARGTPEGKALHFTIRSSFLLAAINAVAVTAADRSRIVNLPLDAHDNDKERARKITTALQDFEGASANWCLQAMALTAEILTSIKTLQRLFPPCDSRHATNMSTLLAAAWVMLHKREIDEASAEALIADHIDIIGELAEAHAHDDSEECWKALLQYSVGMGDRERLLSEDLGELKALKQSIQRGADPDTNFNALQRQIGRFGMKLDGNFLIVANSHRGLQEVYRGTLWEAGNWGDALKRLPGATAAKQRRFEGGQRSLGTMVPIDLIPDHDPPADPEF